MHPRNYSTLMIPSRKIFGRLCIPLYDNRSNFLLVGSRASHSLCPSVCMTIMSFQARTHRWRSKLFLREFLLFLTCTWPRRDHSVLKSYSYESSKLFLFLLVFIFDMRCLIRLLLFPLVLLSTLGLCWYCRVRIIHFIPMISLHIFRTFFHVTRWNRLTTTKDRLSSFTWSLSHCVIFFYFLTRSCFRRVENRDVCWSCISSFRLLAFPFFARGWRPKKKVILIRSFLLVHRSLLDEHPSVAPPPSRRALVESLHPCPSSTKICHGVYFTSCNKGIPIIKLLSLSRVVGRHLIFHSMGRESFDTSPFVCFKVSEDGLHAHLSTHSSSYCVPSLPRMHSFGFGQFSTRSWSHCSLCS